MWWQFADDVRGYALTQAAATFIFRKMMKRAVGRDRRRLAQVYSLNALAKLCEMLDRPIWRASGKKVSGHTLKHLFIAAGFGLAEAA